MLWALPACFPAAKGTKKIGVKKSLESIQNLMKEKQSLKWTADTVFGKRFLELPMTFLMGEGPGQIVFLHFFDSISHIILIFTRRQTIWSNKPNLFQITNLPPII